MRPPHTSIPTRIIRSETTGFDTLQEGFFSRQREERKETNEDMKTQTFL